MKSFLISTLVCCLIGCTAKPIPQPVAPIPIPVPTIEAPPPVVQPPPEPKRTDLPLNWSEVKGDSWSYGVPMGFDPIKHDYTVLAAHESSEQQLSVTLQSEANNTSNLQDYVNLWLLAAENLAHKEALQTGLKQTQIGPVIAVQLIWETEKDEYSSSIDFFVQRINTIYHVSCTADNIHMLKKHSMTCFDIMDTFRLK